MQQSLQLSRELDWEGEWLDTSTIPWDRDGTHGEGDQQDGTPWSEPKILTFSARELGTLMNTRIQDVHTGNSTRH